MDALGELAQVVVADVVAAVLAHRGEDELEELVAAQLVERGRDDPQALEQLDSCRCSMPGSSLRLARSPVAPKRTTVVAGMTTAWRKSVPEREGAGAGVTEDRRRAGGAVP